MQQAYDPLRPRQVVLQDMYAHLKSDGHWLSTIKLRNAATLCTDYSVQNEKGEVLPDDTKLLKSRWFRTFLREALSCNLYGGELIELPYGETITVKPIPRRNTKPNSAIVFPYVWQETTIDCTAMLGDSIIKIDNDEDMFGIVEQLCGLLIWKRNTMQAWAEFIEKFGMPMITATTTKTNEADISQIEGMLRQLGEAAQAVLPQGTSIDIKQNNLTDAYQVYLQFIKLCDDQISKAILGGTMILDNGASKSQSEVHERNLDEKIAAEDRISIGFIINDQLFPLLKSRGLISQDAVFVWDTAFEIELTEHWKIVTDMLDRGGEFDDDAIEWIRKRFNVPISGINPVQQQQQQATTTKPQASRGMAANFR